METAEIAEDLFSLLETDRCIAWVGSGLSRLAPGIGYPDWETLLTRLCQRCGVPQLTGPRRSQAEALIDKAQECKDQDLNAYHQCLLEEFDRDNVLGRKALSLLTVLPFKALITTNFDPLLSETGALHQWMTLAYPNLRVSDIFEVPKPIFYIHGHVRTPPPAERLVLSRNEFEAAYADGVGSFIEQVLRSFPILFVGASLAEPEVKAVFQRVRELHGKFREEQPKAEVPERRILLSALYTDGTSSSTERRDHEAEAAEDAQLTHLDAKVLRYDPLSEQHSGLDKILRTVGRLAEAVGDDSPNFIPTSPSPFGSGAP